MTYFMHDLIFLLFTKIMRERLLWQKSPRFRRRALDLVYIKLSDTQIAFKPSILVRKPSNTRKLYQNNFSSKCTSKRKLAMLAKKFHLIFGICR